MMQTLNRQQLLQKIIDVKSKYCITNREIKLLAVSKTRQADELLQLYQQGQRAFGESYLQEAREKQTLLSKYDIEWHFIGRIQSNKLKIIAPNFDWIQSVDQKKHLASLAKHRPDHLPPLNILLQVNFSSETQKGGVTDIDDLIDLCEVTRQYSNLKLRGLMAIPQKAEAFSQQQQIFAQIASIYQQLKPRFAFDTLSMGMSNDYPAAICEGSTMIRVGSLLFGERKYA